MNPGGEYGACEDGCGALTVKVGLISVQVELDGLHLGQVAMLRVLVCVTVRPGTHGEQFERWLPIPDHTERHWRKAKPRSLRQQRGAEILSKILTLIKIRRAAVTQNSRFWTAVAPRG